MVSDEAHHLKVELFEALAGFLTIFITIALVVGVVFVFLQNWRATIIPVVAIPSLVGTFPVLAAFGASINNLSLFGLVLAVGIVVDDAIVVVGSVVRPYKSHFRRSLKPQRRDIRPAPTQQKSIWALE